MSIITKKLKLLIFFLFLSIIFSFKVCLAQFLEVFAVMQQLNGDKTTFMEQELTVSDNILGGLGAGFNIDNVNLNMVFLFGSTEITSEEVNLESELFAFEANLDYTFLSGMFSPVISAGIGSITFTDSFVAYENFNETNFSYNIAGGIRCLFNEHFLLKALYKATWTKIKDTENSIQLNGIAINLGYLF
jgi:hypothetical protein